MAAWLPDGVVDDAHGSRAAVLFLQMEKVVVNQSIPACDARLTTAKI
jgi:hypothetical protein